MKDGFITVATATPRGGCRLRSQRSGDSCMHQRNGRSACKGNGASRAVHYGLYLQRFVLADEIARRGRGGAFRYCGRVTPGGCPYRSRNALRVAGKLLNVAAILCRGKVLGFVPKVNLPAYNEFYETRHFTSGSADMGTVQFGGEEIPVGTNLLFSCENVVDLCVAAELCEDLWVPNPPSVQHALAGASVICNLSASDEMVGKEAIAEIWWLGNRPVWCAPICTPRPARANPLPIWCSAGRILSPKMAPC